MTNNVWRNFAAEWRDFLASATPDRIEGFLASLAPGEASRRRGTARKRARKRARKLLGKPVRSKSHRRPMSHRADRRGSALRDLLERHEGRRAFPYPDTVGKLTIGVGRNLSDRGLSEDEIDLLLANDIAIAGEACADIFGPGFAGMAAPRRQALISMAFNLGGPRLAAFRRMRAAIAAGDWDEAAAEALDSRWAAQTGSRADEIAALLRSG